MSAHSASGLSPAFQDFRARLADSPPEGAELSAVLSRLEKEDALEAAYRLLKQEQPLSRSGKDPLWRAVHRAFQVRVDLRRQRRMGTWQHDPHRRTLRLRFEVQPPATALNPGALQSALSKTLADAGLPLALGLEKTPRPLVRLGHPLPQEVPGLSEWGEVVLREAPPCGLLELPDKVNAHAHPGLRILDAREVPNHGSPVLELSAASRWRWSCPPALEAAARQSVAAFLASPSFHIEKRGKVAGQKAVKRIEIRSLVTSMAWDGPDLRFSTRIQPGEALNPARLLGGILDLEPSGIVGLVREAVDLREDPKLQRPDRYEPKLSNLYEDAVLLQAGPALVVIEDEDEEPLRLG